MELAAYRRSLAVEYRSHVENARAEQAAAVLAELDRCGGVPEGLRDAADHTPRETAVHRRSGRQKEN